MLKPTTKLWLNKGKKSIMGEGRAQLLQAIDEHGSIQGAAHAMNMSYRHAWGIIRGIQNALGEEIVETSRGGAKGGGAQLTAFGREILQQYDDNAKGITKLLKYGPKPDLAVDGIIFHKNDKVILIRRKNPPYKGKLALPGGFVEYNETTAEAIKREVREELGIKTRIKRLIGVYSAPGRDPRGHVVSVVYELERISGSIKAGDDAESFELVSFDKVLNSKEIAFDHAQIISDANSLKKGRNYSND